MSNWTKQYLHLCTQLEACKKAKHQISGAIVQGKRHGEDTSELSIRMAEIIRLQGEHEVELVAMRQAITPKQGVSLA